MFVLQGYKLLDNVNFRPTLLGVWVSDQRSYSFTVDLYWNNLPLYFGFNFKTLKKTRSYENSPILSRCGQSLNVWLSKCRICKAE